MATWFLFAFGSAVMQSWVSALSKRAVDLKQYSKVAVSFIAIATASIILFLISYLIKGLPELQEGFWRAVLITGSLNIIMFPLTLKAFEYGEYSSVYSMSLATPIFLLLTSWIFLGEVPPLYGMAGVVLTVIGLIVVTINRKGEVEATNPVLGNMMGLTVALMGSISVNFDKIATLSSDRFFAPACITGFMSIGYITYLVIRRKPILARRDKIPGIFIFSGIAVLLLLGLAQALNNIFYNYALTLGFASYTIAIKRISVIFGVIWAWLFFREKNISKKLLGAGIAVAGVLLILFS